MGNSIMSVIQEIREEEVLVAKAKRAARFAPKIVADPCPSTTSPNKAHRWQYKTGGKASRRTCAYCKEKR